MQAIASLAAIGGAYYEYNSNMRTIRNMRAFLVAAKFVPLILYYNAIVHSA
jgi:hypothetical protein